MNRNITLAVLNMENVKVCELYDSKCQFPGQAVDIEIDYSKDELTELTFRLPYMLETIDGNIEKNFRWDYIKNEYKILLNIDGKEEMFVIKVPEESNTASNVNETVSCLHIAEQLKRRGIINNYVSEVGNASYHMQRALEGTGWVDKTEEMFYEKTLYDKFLTVTKELQTTPSDMSFGAYAEIRDAKGTTKWDNKYGWVNARYTLTSCGKNLCDGMIEKGAIDWNTGELIYEDTTVRYRSINYLYVKPYAGKNLVLSSANGEYAIWHMFDATKKWIAGTVASKIVMLPSDGSCCYIKYELLANEEGTANFLEPPSQVQIELKNYGDEKATDYAAYVVPYKVSFTLGKYDTISRNKITRRTEYDNDTHTVLKASEADYERIDIYSVKLYENGYLYIETEGYNGSASSEASVKVAYTVSDRDNGELREKYRTISKELGVSTFEQLRNIAAAFDGKLLFDGVNKTVKLTTQIGRDTKYAFKPGYNASKITRKRTSHDFVTRLYVINQTSESGYIGIEDVNPLGTNFILDFSYYESLGVLTKAQKEFLKVFKNDIADIAKGEREALDIYMEYSNSLNNLVGRTPMGIATVKGINASDGTEIQLDSIISYDDGDVPAENNKIYLRGSNGHWEERTVSQYNYATNTVILTEGVDSASTVWWVAKPPAGLIGAHVVTIAGKKEILADYKEQLNGELTDEEKEEINTNITNTEEDINELYNGGDDVVGLNQYIAQLVSEIDLYDTANQTLEYVTSLKAREVAELEEIMGDKMHDGVFPSGEYASGQELALFEDCLEYLNEHSHPQVEYSVTGVDRSAFGDEYAIEKLEFGDIVYIDDPDIGIYNVTGEITQYKDKLTNGKLNSFTVSNFNEKPVALFEKVIKSTEEYGSKKRKYNAVTELLDDDGKLNADKIKDSILNSTIGEQMDLTGNKSVINMINSQFTTSNINNAPINWSAVSRLVTEVAIIGQAAISHAIIDSAQIRSLDAGKITTGYLNAERIEAGTITAEHIGAGQITAEHIAAASITSDHIKAGTITAAQIAAGTITAESGILGTAVIGTEQIADSSITAAKIVSLNADVINAGTLSVERLLIVGEDGIIHRINATSSGLTATELTDEQYQKYINGTVIVAKSITADQLAAKTITANEIVASTITANEIAAKTITANEIASGTITATEINTVSLFACQAFLDALVVADISNNESLNMVVGDYIASVNVGGIQLLRRSKYIGNDWKLTNSTKLESTDDSEMLPEHVRISQTSSDSTEWKCCARSPLIKLPDSWEGLEAVLSAYINSPLWSDVDSGITWTLCLSNGSETAGYSCSKYAMVKPGNPEFGSSAKYDTQLANNKFVRGWTEYKLDAANFSANSNPAPTYEFSDCTHMFVRFWLRKNGTVYTVAPKLEWGNKATDWSPSPADTEEDITQAYAKISMQEDEINAAVMRISEAETALSLKADSATVTSKTDELEAKIKAIPGEINLAVGKISVGGTNLLNDTKDITTGTAADKWRMSANGTSIFTQAGNDFKCIKLTSTGATDNTWYGIGSPVCKLPAGWSGKEVTLSAWIYSPKWENVDKGISWNICLNSNGSTTRARYRSKYEIVSWGKAEVGDSATSDTPLANGKWTRVATTFTMTSDYFTGGEQNVADFESNTHVFAQFFLAQNGEVYIYGPKLEFGNKATDWSPSPEDTEGKIDAVSAELKVATDGINANIQNVSQNLQSQIDLVPDQITMEVSKINVGNAQLLKETRELPTGTTADKWRLGTGVSTYSQAGTDFKRLKFVSTGATSDTWNGASSPVFKLPSGWVGANVTLSAWIYSADWTAVDRGITWGLCLNNDGSPNRMRYGSKYSIVNFGKVEFGSDAKSDEELKNYKWVRVATTFTLTADALSGGTQAVEEFESNTHCFVQFFLRRNGNVRIYAPKLEFGDKATHWMSSIDDPVEQLKTSYIKIAEDSIDMGTGGKMLLRSGSKFGIESAEVNITTDIFKLQLTEGTDSVTVMATQNDGYVDFKGITAGNIRQAVYNQLSLKNLSNGMTELAEILTRTDARRILYTATADESGDVMFDKFSGSLTIKGEGYKIPRITLGRGFTGTINVENAILSQSTDTNYAFHAGNGTAVLYNCWFVPGTTHGVLSEYGASVRWYNAQTAANLTAMTLTWAFYARYCGEITYTGKIPGGQMQAVSGFITESSGTTTTVVSGTSTKPTETTATASLNATLGYYGTTSGWVSGSCFQGYSTGKGQIYGCLKFDVSSLSGKTVKSAKLTLHRKSGVGRNRDAAVYVYGTTTAWGSEPTIASKWGESTGLMAWDESGTLEIGVTGAQNLVNGSGKQFLLYTGETSTYDGAVYSQHYAQFDSATLTITYAV